MSYAPRPTTEAFPTGKTPVRVASVSNITLAAPGSTIDGVTLAVNDRVLLKNQSTGSQNGIWTWNGAAVAMSRADDANSAAELPTGLTVYIKEGTVNAKRTYTLTTLTPIVVGTTSLLFEELDDTGGGSPTVDGFTTVRAAAGGVNSAVLPAAIDGVTMVAGDRFLIPSSSNTGNAPSSATTNGLWVYTTAGQAATRPTDYSNGSVINGLLVLVTEGTANAYDSGAGRGLYSLAQAVTVGSTSHVWGKLYDSRATDTGSTPSTTTSRRFFGQLALSNHITMQQGVTIGSGNGTDPLNISHGAAITASLTLTADTNNRGFLVYTGTGGHTITLPAANTMVSASYGLFNLIANRGTGVVSIAPGAGSTLNGQTAVVPIPIGAWGLSYGVSTTDTAVVILDAVGNSNAAPAPLGTIEATARTTAPAGWLLCNGSAISRTTYVDLFNAIGTTYGAGDGTTTFNIPNTAGRTLMGAGTGAQDGSSGTGIITGGTAMAARTLGAWGGATLVTLTAAQSGTTAHSHTLNDPGHVHPYAGHTYVPITGSGATLVGTASASNFGINGVSNVTGITVNNSAAANASAGHENLSPFVVVNYMIKAQYVEDTPGWGNSNATVVSGATPIHTASGSYQNLSFTGTELDDATGMHDTVTNADRITILRDGTYVSNAYVIFNNNATGTRAAEIVHSRHGALTHWEAAAIGTANLSTSLSGIAVPCIAGDYFTVTWYQNSGANLTAAAPSKFSVTRTGYAANPVGAITPVGATVDYFGATEPTDGNWKFPAGQAISRTVYAELFTLLGTTYGAGDGSTTFNLPDLRGRVGVALDNMGGSDAGRLSTANTLGLAGGVEGVLLTAAQSGLPAHTHGVTGSITQYLGPTLTTYLPAAGSGVGGTVNTAAVAAFSLSATANAAADAASSHTNMQPYMLVNKLIRVR